MWRRRTCCSSPCPTASKRGASSSWQGSSIPKLRVFARAHSDAEVEHLKGFGADLIVSGEKEIAEAMIRAATHVIPRRLPASA